MSCIPVFQMDRWTERKKKAVEYKGGSCMKCGHNRNLAALVFNHRDPTQKMQVRVLAGTWLVGFKCGLLSW